MDAKNGNSPKLDSGMTPLLDKETVSDSQHSGRKPHPGGGISHSDCVANQRRTLSGFGPQILVCDDSSGRGSGKTVCPFER